MASSNADQCRDARSWTVFQRTGVNIDGTIAKDVPPRVVFAANEDSVLLDFAHKHFSRLPQCTEYAAMSSGMRYNAMDPALRRGRAEAAVLAAELLRVDGNDPEDVMQRRREVLKRFVGYTDGTAVVEPPFRTDYGFNIFLGSHFYSNFNCTMLDCAPIVFGNNVMLGPNVMLSTASHPVDAQLRTSGVELANAIVVGHNVWIGGNCTILGGVSIGDNCVIAAGAVVNRSIPPNCVAGGVPARVLRVLGPNGRDDRERTEWLAIGYSLDDITSK